MYINNRTVRACKNSIKQAIKAGANTVNAQRLLNSFNSYIGFMCHVRSFKIQRMLADMIEQSEFKEYLYFEERKCQIVCKMHDKYKPIEQHTQEIKELKSYYKNNRYEHKQLSPNGATCRRTS
jgi:hypothetical protein